MLERLSLAGSSLIPLSSSLLLLSAEMKCELG
jgi:hypothetical protein